MTPSVSACETRLYHILTQKEIIIFNVDDKHLW